MTTEKATQLESNQDNLSSIPARLAAPSPPLFAKLAKVFVTLGSISGAILGANMAGIVLWPALVTVAGYVAITSAVGGTMAGVPVDWNKLAAQIKK